MGSGYDVLPYSIENLKDQFVKLSAASDQIVGNKLQSEYFKGYFDELGAKTIVVETHYIDRDYLEDFAGYYVKCFNAPKSHCARLHFFTSEFNRGTFTKFLRGTVSKESFCKKHLNDSNYLGFIVVKPLPQTFIGRTCLRTYPENGTGRHYPALRNYEANLFGVPLRVKSLAYEEQDTEVAQCATSALWSVLQGTSVKFGHPVPSPVEITKHALAVHARHSRTFPTSDGLTVEQLADAVRKMQLEPYCAYAFKKEVLQTEAYAYLKAGIPALLTVTLWDTMIGPGQKFQINDQHGNPVDAAYQLNGEGESGHAIALTGFRLSPNPAQPYGNSGILLRATRIDRFYVHDDQIGAFARQVLSGPGQKLSAYSRGGLNQVDFMDTSWVGASGSRGGVVASSGMLLVPLYHKMRIPFSKALEVVTELDSFVEELRVNNLTPGLTERLEWDIHLTTASELKSDSDLCVGLTAEQRQRVLTQSMPRFIWRAIGRQADLPFVELLLDATDIVQGQLFLGAVEHVPGAFGVLRNPAITQFTLGMSRTCQNIIRWFLAN